TEEEWQHAAQGPKRLKYPWGRKMKSNVCNNGKSKGTMSVYAFPEGRSPFGCYDMCGNTWEWTESERSNEGRSRFCYIRGGSFYKARGSGWYADNGPQPCARAAKFLLVWPGLDRCSTIGFRCVVDLDGFASIFDGKNLSGWRAVPRESASDWTVRDGAIVGHGSADRLSYLIWKDEHLTDFELKLQYRLPGNGNTGVEVRSQPDLTGKRPFEGYHADLGHVGIGPHVLGAWDFHFARRKEYPCPRGTRLIIDEDGKPHSSSIRGALTLADIRPHQWNDVHIIARGNHFQFFINGKPASEFTDNAKSGRLESHRSADPRQGHERRI
ncbi:MAG: family 16 glycoside hydrolase, partial [Planctomycetota bacterium]